MNSNILTIEIEATPERVYAFAANPANMPHWAPGFVKSVAQVDGAWVIESSLGPVRIAFAPANPFGVLDHVVTLPSGESFNNPMRVVPAGAGSLLSFTLFQQAGTSDADFAHDAATVEGDLQTLKHVAEALPAHT